MGAQENMPIPELLQVELVSDGWIKKYLLTYRLPNGTDYTYESISRKGIEDYRRELERGPESKQNPDALCIVPRTINNELVLIKEFRYPLNSWCIAFPAGLIEPGEDMIECLERELREETGYGLHLIEGKAKTHPLSQAGYSSTGMAEESVQIVYALVEKVGEPEPEPSEFIQVFTLSITDIPAFLQSNTTPMGTRCQLILESFARDSNRGIGY